MDQDDVFIGLPYIFKMQYEDLRHNSPKIEECYDKIKNVSDQTSKRIDRLKANLDKLSQSINELFMDLSTNKPRNFKDSSDNQ